MEPPPPPPPSASGRFRLRVQIYPPQDAYDLSAAPLRQFTIVKTSVLSLPDLTLRELCDEVVKRFKAVYPGEALFAIDKPQDSYGSDLYLGDCVRDVFADNEVFRVIKGDTIRASVEPHRARSQSVQPRGQSQYNSVGVRKRSRGQSEAGDLLHGQKRQRIATSDSDRPLLSKEQESVGHGVDFLEEQARESTIIQDSQKTMVEDQSGPAVNRRAHRVMNTGKSNPSQARGSDSSEQVRFNKAAMASVSQQFPTTPSLTSSKDDAHSSDSDIQLPRSKIRSTSRRQLTFIDDFSEMDRGQSLSTAVTTPQSGLQQPKNQSPLNDSRKLKRPTARASRQTAEVERTARALPRQNIYEVIETDTEHQNTLPVSQNILSKIGNSHKWKNYQSSKAPNSRRNTPRQHSSVLSNNTDAERSADDSAKREEQHKLELAQKRAAKLAKEQADQGLLRLAFEAAEQRRINAEREEKERLEELRIAREAAEKLRIDLEARKVEADRKAAAEKAAAAAEAKRVDAMAKAEAAKAAQLAEDARLLVEKNTRLEKQRRARLEEEERARLEEEKKARLEEEKARLEQEKAMLDEEERVRLEEEERVREASEANKQRLEADARRKAVEEKRLQEQATLNKSQQKNSKKIQDLQALEATVRRAASTPAKGGASQEYRSAAKASAEAESVDTPSPAHSGMSSNKRVTCTPFIPRGRRPTTNGQTLVQSPQASVGSSPRTSSAKLGIGDKISTAPQLQRKVSFADQVPPSATRSSSSSTSFQLKQTKLVPPRLVSDDVKSTPRRTSLRANSSSSKSSKGKAKVVESPGAPPTPTIDISSDEESTSHARQPVFKRNSYAGVGSSGPANDKGGEKQVMSPPNSQPQTSIIVLDGSTEHRFNGNQSEVGKTDRKDLLNNTSQGAGNKQEELLEVEEEQQSDMGDEESEDELDSIEMHDALKPEDSLPPFRNGRDISTNLKGDESETNDDEEEEVEDEEAEEEEKSDGPNDDPRSFQTQVLVKNGQNNPAAFNTIVVNEATDEELEEDSINGKESIQGESSIEEPDKDSEAMQAQVDDQIFSQSLESQPLPMQPTTNSKNNTILPPSARDTGLLVNHASERPSLRRMNLEAQRTKEANLEAAKARGLAKAQKMRSSVVTDEMTEESSEDVSSSEGSSSSSDDGVDEVTPSSRKNNRNLANGADEMSQMVLSESIDRDARSFAKPLALNSASREQGTTFQSNQKLHVKGDKKDADKSTKIGWARLSKQFSANKRKSGSQM